VPTSPGTLSQASEPTLSSSTVTLSWNAVSGATSYEVAVRDLVTNQIVVDQTVSGTSDQASLSSGGSYRWDVDAINSAGASNFSSPLYFLTPASGGGGGGGSNGRPVAGFDSGDYPGKDVMAWLKTHTNLSWVGYYLGGENSNGTNINNYDYKDDFPNVWMGTRKTLVDQGWNIAPIFVGQQDPNYEPLKLYSDPDQSTGQTDGATTVSMLESEGFAKNTIVYLDWETGLASGQALTTAETAYFVAWAAAVSGAGYGIGIYCPFTAAGAIQAALQAAPAHYNASFWVADVNGYAINDPAPFEVSGDTFPTPDPSDGNIYTGSGFSDATSWQYRGVYVPNSPNYTVLNNTTAYDLSSLGPNLISLLQTDTGLSELAIDLDSSTVWSKTAAATPPTVTTQTASQTWTIGQAVDLILPSNTFTDPQNESLAYKATLTSGAALPSWLTFNATTRTFTGTVPATATSLSLKVTATDTSGLSASETFTATVPAPAAPILTAQTAGPTWTIGQAVDLILSSNTFTDPQHETLTYKAMLASGTALPSWLGFNAASRTFTGTVPTTAASLNINVTVTDTSGLSASETFTATVPAPTAPTVTAQTAAQTWTVGETVNLPLASNTFTDPQHESLTYKATLASGTALPSWLSFNATTRTFTGKVPTNATSLSVKVTATDTSGLSNSESFAVTVPPLAAPNLTAPTAAQTWTIGKTVSLPLASNTFTDPQHESLTYKAALASGAALPSWLSFNATTRTFTGKVPANPTTFGVKVTATDTSGLSNSETFAVTVPPPPVVNNDSYSTKENTALTISAPGVLGNDTDSDGDSLTVASHTNPSHGLLTLNANGSFTYTPAKGYTGTDSFTYFAADGTAKSTSAATVTIAINTPSTVQTVIPLDQDIWTTSTFSYAPGGGGPGGGLANDVLQVGGWGDLYYSLLEFNLSGLPAQATNVELRLFDTSDSGGTPTSLDLYRITEPWNWQTQGTGSDRLRLWWADQPTAVTQSPTALPAPTVGSYYYIDITTLYNEWQAGTLPNYGIELRPTGNSDNFDSFGSSRNATASYLPALVITTQSGTTINAGATVELGSSSAGTVTFAASTGTLQLDSSSSFTGKVAGMTGQDTIDLQDINFATVHKPTFSGTSSGGTLTVTDGTHSANIALLGNYLASTFVASSDGHGGTNIVDPLLIASNQQTVLTQPHHT
jgi:VCBS repeat-containing protein